MKNLMLAALAALSLTALSLTAAAAPAADAYVSAAPHNTCHSRPYDNTGHGPDETGMEGGG